MDWQANTSFVSYLKRLSLTGGHPLGTRITKVALVWWPKVDSRLIDWVIDLIWEDEGRET